MRLVLAQGLAPVGLGVAVGLGLAAALSRLVAQLLFGVEPWDAGIFAVIVLTVLIVAAAASVVPARRATRIDPMIALRHE